MGDMGMRPGAAGPARRARTIPTRWILLRMALFSPTYIRHFLQQPYRSKSPGQPSVGPRMPWWLRRHRIALYDGTLDLILSGYAEVSGSALRPSSGRMAVLLTRVGFAFDDQFEKRIATNTDVTFESVLESEGVQGALADWRDFMTSDPCYPAMRAFLTDFVGNLHSKYINSVESVASVDVPDILDRAALDSGGLLMTLGHALALYNGETASRDVLTQLSALGIAGKIADDMADFRRDLTAQRPNILQVIASLDEEEGSIAAGAARSTIRLDANWWRMHCPRSFSIFAALCSNNYNALSSRSLRRAWILLWLPAHLGRSLEAGARGRI